MNQRKKERLQRLHDRLETERNRLMCYAKEDQVQYGNLTMTRGQALRKLAARVEEVNRGLNAHASSLQ